MATRHFHVEAQEMLFERPECFPLLPALQLLGVAMTPAGQGHLILTLGEDRSYFGPDSATVARRTAILIAALKQGPVALDDPRAYLIDAWVSTAWEATLDALTNLISAGDLAHL